MQTTQPKRKVRRIPYAEWIGVDKGYAEKIKQVQEQGGIASDAEAKTVRSSVRALKTARIGTLAGILALGVVTFANAQGWAGCCGSTPAASQDYGVQGGGATTNTAWICPHQGTNGVAHCDFQGVPATGTTAPDATVSQYASHDGCHHWYRWVPGHHGRCNWNGNNGSNWNCN